MAHCPRCGEIPPGLTRRSRHDKTILHCVLCGAKVGKTGHPAEAA